MPSAMYPAVAAALRGLAALLLLLLPASTAASTPAPARHYGQMSLASHGLTPRFYLEASPLDRRQSGGCNEGYHPCLDINATACCADTTYCMVDPATWAARCCALGSACGSPCQPDQYQCNVTTTTTTTAGAAAAAASTYAACCPRPCSSASFLCPASLGGGCCPFGAACASGGVCLAPASASSSSASAVVSEAPPGCTTGQVACPGGGCCAASRACTAVAGTPLCGPATATPAAAPTASGVSAVPRRGGRGLSPGATAGVAAGVVVGAGSAIAAATWLCLRRRRGGRTSRGGGGSSSNGGRAGASGGGGGGGPAPVGETAVPDGAAGGRLPGLAAEYFGPGAVAGPFTDAPTAAATPPGYLERGVPPDPHGPDDIVGAVEMGESGEMWQQPQPQQHLAVIGAAQAPETVHRRLELYGSEMPTPELRNSMTRTPPGMTRGGSRLSGESG